MTTRRASSGLHGQPPSKKRKEASLISSSFSKEPAENTTESILFNKSRSEEPAKEKTESVSLLKLPDELLVIVAEFRPLRLNGNHNLTSLMLTCRKLYEISCQPAYEVIHYSPSRFMARELANVELVFRSLLRNPGLGKYVKKINIDNRPWSGGTDVETVPIVFACVPDGYLNRSDLKLAYEFISAISNLPIFGEFPAGRYTKAHRAGSWTEKS